MKKILFFIVLFGALSVVACAQESVLQVKIIVPENLTNDVLNQSHDSFYVSTVIKNISKEGQQINYWSCSFENSWVSTHSDLLIKPRSCKKNVIVEKVLEPGEEFIRDDLLLIISSRLKSNTITFQLGFDPHLSVEQMNIDDNRLIWSNEVTIVMAPEK